MEGAIFSFGLWCNGNTTDSGPVFLGSNPSSPTSLDICLSWQMFFIVWSIKKECRCFEAMHSFLV